MAEPLSISFRTANGELYKAAAERRGLRLSDWLRDAGNAALQAQGFSAAEEAGLQYCLVAPDGQILLGPTFRMSSDDRGTWLPVENIDSAPFDPALHWRLKPLPLWIEGDKVVREYPVVMKTMERA